MPSCCSSERSRVPHDRLPAWQRVVAVVAHPDDESFGLGAVLAGYESMHATTVVVCLTHGEAANADRGLGQLRARELAAAARTLGVSETVLLSYPDGGLSDICPILLAGEVIDVARRTHADGLLAFDPSGVTGHPDHAAATFAALTAAAVVERPALGWTIPLHVAATLNTERGAAFTGTADPGIDYVIPVDRTKQLAAIAAHASQLDPDSPLWRRLELLGATEYLRLLHGQRSRH